MQWTCGNAGFLEHRLDLQGLFSDGIFVTSIDGTAIAWLPIAAERVGISFAGRDYLLRALRDGRSMIGPPLLSRLHRFR